MLAPTVTRLLIERFSAPQTVVGDDGVFAALTPRECDALRLLARGLSNADFAERLTGSETTVKSHVARVLVKLDVHDRVQAVVLAYERGFVVPGEAGGSA